MHSLYAVLFAAVGVHLISAQSNATDNATTQAAPVSCVASGAAVDWYLVYKDPSSLLIQILVASASPMWQELTVTISQSAGNPIYDTMAVFVNESAASTGGDTSNTTNTTAPTTAPPRPAVIAYNDQPPGVLGAQSSSNAKGIILTDVQLVNGSAVVWVVHTVPKFLGYNAGYEWPSSQASKGHMFLCLAVQQSAIGVLAQQLRYQRALVYYYYLPTTVQERSEEIKLLLEDKGVTVPPFGRLKKIKTNSTTNQLELLVYSKTAKSMLDTYKKTLRSMLKGDMNIWVPSKSDYKSYCVVNSVRKIISPITINGRQVERENDMSKWLVSKGTTNYWCLTSNDYSAKEKKSPGSVVCVAHAGLYSVFSTIGSNVESCAAAAVPCVPG